ncbi:MAG: hypothetical protein IJ790_00920 [Lachnospiraceae bacterium]|nr:hypothetical protein [Lachnospiraceae bacterium]
MTCILIKNNGSTIVDISDIISEVSFGGSIEQGARELEIAVVNNGTKYDIGDVINFKDTDIDYVGQILKTIEPDKQEILNIEAVDFMSHWTRSYTTKIVNSTAEAVATEFCGYMGMAMGNIASTSIATGERVYQNKTLYHIVNDLYKRAGALNGKEYLIRTIGATFNVIEKGKVVDYIIGDAINLESVEKQEDASKVVNKVVVFNDKHIQVNEKTNSTLEKLGLYQKVADKDDNLDEILTDIENTLIVKGIGDNSCQAGKYIRFVDSATNITGIYEITEDNHTINSNGHKMTLRLSFVRVA